MELKVLGRYLAVLLLSVCLLAAAATAEDTESDSASAEDYDPTSESSEQSDVTEPAASRPPHEPTLVTVTEGQLRGLKEQARNGKEFYSFRGTPFAAPPVGRLRFQPPQKAKSWEGVRNAVADPPFCPQMSEETVLQSTKFVSTGQEDCLYLSVFSPMLEPVTPQGPNLPVMVFIHGGGYYFGKADQFQPYTLMTEDIVLVVIQYRLGTLGFLSTEDDVAPGNMGILDQTFALDWIQRNAASFGGNPLMITIFGESAGGSSVHLHMFSHMSEGYFHRAIMQSGNAISSWSLANNHRDVAYFIAKMLGCGRLADAEIAANCTMNKESPGEYESCLVDLMSSKEIMECLMDAPVEVLTESYTWFFKFVTFPLVMGPRVDKNLLIQDPLLLLKEGRYKRVDTMMGVNKDEGAMFTTLIYSNEELRTALNLKFEELAPAALDFSPRDIAPLNQAIRIFDQYIGRMEIDRETTDDVAAMFGDRYFWYPLDTAAYFHAGDCQSKKKKKNTFVYEFAYRGKKSLIDHFGPDFGKHWVGHGDELMYLFGGESNRNFAFNGSMSTEEDQEISDMMVKIWTNFAATGNPTPGDEPASWQPYDANHPRVFIIDTESRMTKSDKKSEIRQFWQQLPLKSNLVLFPDSVVNLNKAEVAPDPEAPVAVDIAHESESKENTDDEIPVVELVSSEESETEKSEL